MNRTSGLPAALTESATRPLWDDESPREIELQDLPTEQIELAIIGAGFTGLWTALLGTTPAVLFEAEHVGFGASGRNGGWCSALFPISGEAIARKHGSSSAHAMLDAMRTAQREVGERAADFGIDCDWAQGGTLVAARSPAQWDRMRQDYSSATHWNPDLQLLSAHDMLQRVGMDGVLGGTYTPHCAALHPGRLVRGLGEAARSAGHRILERTPVLGVTSHDGWHDIYTARGSVRARTVIIATEGFTPRLRGLRRRLIPLHSLMIATQPLPRDAWDSIGLRQRETFADYRHLIIYGQRTADDRIAFGGRGAPYRFGSRIDHGSAMHEATHSALWQTLVEMFPLVRDFSASHRWGGPLGVARDWWPCVEFDNRRRIGRAGGYVGDGVSTSYLAAKTLNDLMSNRSSDVARLPWVGHRSRNWELEPMRWFGTHAGLWAMTSADQAEARTGRPAGRARLMSRFIGE